MSIEKQIELKLFLCKKKSEVGVPSLLVTEEQLQMCCDFYLQSNKANT